MQKLHVVVSLLLYLIYLTVSVQSQNSPDAPSMQALKASLGNPENLGWSDPDPCKWSHVQCVNNRVTNIQIGDQNLKGTLPLELNNLTSLTKLEVMRNQLSGSIPSLAGLNSLQQVLFNDNNFAYIPPDFFSGLTSLQIISLDYNPFSAWEITDNLKDASGLQIFSANGANVTGTIPDFLGGDTFPGLTTLHLAFNNLQGPIPFSFAKTSIQSLWLNGQKSDSKLNGSIAVIQSMTYLTEVWLHGNRFTGPIPDLSGLSNLNYLSLRDNQLTGTVPFSVVNLPNLAKLNLTNNLLQGPTPKFDTSKVDVDMIAGTNNFCLDEPGVACDSRVDVLLSTLESVGYPVGIAESWQGNDPCNIWRGVACSGGNITVVNFKYLGLWGTISPNFYMIPSLKQLLLSNNSLTGIIPNELTSLPDLRKLDVSNNNLYGEVPNFRSNVVVITQGNPNLGK
ncbi:hypothetical protein ACOSP7_019301 [Xanthoceras sorbifolium]|uniref:Leucine-rich repeat-containing N-terminal plant-type domain-containing protein n=1 Tax=Xanthoceras sorbifolium TaxID=99658 RepID=A0ABQ8GZP3_9ROSI|nr:hypothetical protein JRO89_XSUnG0068700 [Xanthoceras sorbifolium]